MKFTEQYIDIPTDIKAIIKHPRKSLLLKKRGSWMKKASGLLDVAIGAFGGAEVCKHVCNLLLHKLSEKYERKYLALYRENRIGILKKVSGPASEKIQKYFCKLFREHYLELIIQCNRRAVNFVDVS